jgi:hypothetical protein
MAIGQATDRASRWLKRVSPDVGASGLWVVRERDAVALCEYFAMASVVITRRPRRRAPGPSTVSECGAPPGFVLEIEIAQFLSALVADDDNRRGITGTGMQAPRGSINVASPTVS